MPFIVRFPYIILLAYMRMIRTIQYSDVRDFHSGCGSCRI